MIHICTNKLTVIGSDNFFSPKCRQVIFWTNVKRKPQCIGGMELVSLSCIHVFISAESVGRGWCKIAIATKWYQFHTKDKCGFLFMLWITNQYTFVRYTKLVNKIGTAAAKVIMFYLWQLSVTYTQYDMPPHPTLSCAELEWRPCDQHASQCAE